LNILTIAHIVEVPLTIGLLTILVDGMGLAGIAWALVLAMFPSVVISQFSFFDKRRSKKSAK
jgi:Na+-driven multidrug efflux pump